MRYFSTLFGFVTDRVPSFFKRALLKTETLFENPQLTVQKRSRQLRGTSIDRTMIDMPPAVMIVAIDTQNNIHYLDEYMASTDDYVRTFAKGRIDEHETPELAAQRELHEELGLEGDLEHLMTVANQPSHTTAVTHIFVARNCTPAPFNREADEEPGALIHRTEPYTVVTSDPAEFFSCVRSIAAAQALRLQDLQKN